MEIRDIVTIGLPFGDDTTGYVVCGILDADTSQLCQGEEVLAYRNEYLTKIGEGGTLALSVNQRVIRDWEFRNRFTQSQLIGIMRAAMAGDDVAALVWLKLSTASDGVDLTDMEVSQGVQYIAATHPELAIDPAVILA
jgi:hypothetical protein